MLLEPSHGKNQTNFLANPVLPLSWWSSAPSFRMAFQCPFRVAASGRDDCNTTSQLMVMGPPYVFTIKWVPHLDDVLWGFLLVDLDTGAGTSCASRKSKGKPTPPKDVYSSANKEYTLGSFPIGIYIRILPAWIGSRAVNLSPCNPLISRNGVISGTHCWSLLQAE